ncbi:hypothetical protein O181_021480 [Austropuccinia psidii MF-1]|uniref:Matrin-type domain-containing protein n=1 Tax=Austropuccinia psidii MF-1 TaxID=1389203 RepID=A0A9Q3GX53_9BASI|nr:hypothetical protein [Austropuccinia psidii MF-1]
MSFSMLEDMRATHQDLDRLSSHLTALLLPGAPRSHRDRLVQAHRANYLAELVTLRAGSLLDYYTDQDGERATEIEQLSNNSGGELAEFYSRLGRLNDFHRKYPNQPLIDIAPPLAFDWSGLEGELVDGRDFIDRMFTGEEMLGRYLDLHLLHDTYNNLTSTSASVLKRLTYISYIDSFDQFSNIPRTTKSRPEYGTYLKDLRDYVESFYRRIHPLYDLDADISKLREEFEANWDAGQVKGWSHGSADHAMGIWCEACTKHYSKQTVYDAHLKSKRHLRAIERLKEGDSREASSEPVSSDIKKLRQTKDKPLALLEQEIQLFGKLLESVRVDTKANVERRAALTDKERQQEIEEYEARELKERLEAERLAELSTNVAGAPAETMEEDDEEETRIYNPLKLPLGWDGKPIPYWLYKLHGLGVEYKCEICSDFIYMGRKNFERHFQESRHAFGMRALGLPNTKHFHEITRIEDAFALAEKLKSEGRAEVFREETMEELEDEEGNVYNRKTYEDLQRQGLL